MELIGLLMIEHRLIEQIIQPLETELDHIAQDHVAHPVFIDRAVDFFRTYVDGFHHGKEEDILFVELAKKPLTPEHTRIMTELVDEHRLARSTVGQLMSSTENWLKGDVTALTTIAESLHKLRELYPRHIMKEDTAFFLPCQDYFTSTERAQLLEAGIQFDQHFTNVTYRTRMKTLRAHGTE